VTRDLRSHVRPHPPQPDPDVPADHQGRRFCRCGVPVVDGDPRHTVTVLPDGQRAAAHDTDDEEA
jgi:hypothetical protein